MLTKGKHIYVQLVGLPLNSAEWSPVSATQEVSLERTHVGLSFFFFFLLLFLFIRRVERLTRLPNARLSLASGL